MSSLKSKRDSVDGYFLASRSMNWIPVSQYEEGHSIVRIVFRSGPLCLPAISGPDISLAWRGQEQVRGRLTVKLSNIYNSASGIGIATFEMNAIFILMLLGWVFVPVYMAAGVFTMPEYLRARFGGQRIRVFLSILALLLYVFTKISADLYAGALFIKEAMQLEGEEGLYISILALLAIAAIFTIGGGLSAVIWTDFIQTILMIIGAVILMVKSFDAVGGYEALIDKYKISEPDPQFSSFYPVYDEETDSMVNKSCSAVKDTFMKFFRPVDVDSGDLPWTGLLTGMFIR